VSIHSICLIDPIATARLAALVYPEASKGESYQDQLSKRDDDILLFYLEHFRVGCDLMNLFFVIDEYTDVEPPTVVREMVDVMIDALKNPYKPRPEGENIFGQMMKEFVNFFPVEHPMTRIL